nr:putative LLM class F420-dependent oxidoreductase [uncultured bacterium]
MTINIGRVGIWTGVLDQLPVPEAQAAAKVADDLGYGALWIPETLGRDPFLMAALFLQATENIALATGIANIYARDPLTMANTLRTLEAAYPGRFLMGLGVSHQTLVQFVRKHDYSKPYSTMVEYLTFMLEKARFMADGPKDLPDSIVLAALGPKMLKLAADKTSGAHPYFTTPAHTAQAREIIGPDSLLAPEQMVILDENPDTARALARKNMSVYLGLPNYANNLKRLGFTDSDIAGEAEGDGPSDALVDAIVCWGNEVTIAARVAEHHQAGADHVCVQVLADTPQEVIEGWKRLADTLL